MATVAGRCDVYGDFRPLLDRRDIDARGSARDERTPVVLTVGESE
jgi:hypothetical protein